MKEVKGKRVPCRSIWDDGGRLDVTTWGHFVLGSMSSTKKDVKLAASKLISLDNDSF